MNNTDPFTAGFMYELEKHASEAILKAARPRWARMVERKGGIGQESIARIMGSGIAGKKTIRPGRGIKTLKRERKIKGKEGQ